MIEHDGVVYARVTEVLKPFTNFEGITEDILNRKARIGTNVHCAISHFLEGASFSLVMPRERNYFDSFVKWHAEAKPTVVGDTEQRLYCPKKRITGCIDAIMQLPSGECVLCDWKTSSGESRVVWPMQGHLYHYLLAEHGIKVSDRLLFIKLDPKGDLPRIHQYMINHKTMSECMKAIDDFWIKHGDGLAEIGRSS